MQCINKWPIWTEQNRILCINHSYLYKVGVFGISDCDYSMNFLNQLLLFIIIKLHVPLSQSCFPCAVLDENEADLRQETV